MPKYEWELENNKYCTNCPLHLEYPSGFCFSGGHSVQCQLVDWFNPVPPDKSEYFINYPKILEGEELDKLRESLREFIQKKLYVKEYPSHRFILLTDYGDAIVIEAEKEDK